MELLVLKLYVTKSKLTLTMATALTGMEISKSAGNSCHHPLKKNSVSLINNSSELLFIC